MRVTLPVVVIAVFALATSAAAETSPSGNKIPAGGGIPVQAGFTATVSPTTPPALQPQGGYFITPILPAGFTAAACVKGGGAVLHQAGGDVCRTKAPAK